jgi:hypothetical protein
MLIEGQNLSLLRDWENDTVRTGPDHCIPETIRCMVSVSPEIKTDNPD